MLPLVGIEPGSLINLWFKVLDLESEIIRAPYSIPTGGNIFLF